MGTPLPPNEPGNRCFNCFGIGKTFGDVPTPHVMIMQFQGFTPDQAWDVADEPNLLMEHYLIQQADPCIWKVTDDDILWFFHFRPAITLASIEHTVSGVLYFRGDIASPCELLVENDLLTGPGVATLGGLITAWWDPEEID